MKSWKTLLAGIFLVGCTTASNHQTIDVKEAKSMIDNQEVIIIDVREENEYNEGHIKNAVLIPLSTISEESTKMFNKDETILIYCRSGNRSAKAAKKLSSLGYQNIYDFGGILDWSYDIEK